MKFGTFVFFLLALLLAMASAQTDNGGAGLLDVIQDEGVAAIFADNTDTTALAEAVAAEIGAEVAVVELFTGSLGDADSGAATYIEMMRTNAQRIADALG